MAGKLIFVSGLAGSGKTTLIGGALGDIENIEVLTTYTTRPRRSSEQESYEYIFVTDQEYERLKALSNNWDETLYKGYKYASDADKFIADLQNGVNVIVAVTPNIDDIQTMTGIYGQKPVTVWINTPKELAFERVSNDPTRSRRIEDESVKRYFDILFTPKNVLVDDIKSFVNLIRSITQQT